MEWAKSLPPFVLSQLDKNLFQLEYTMARNVYISRADLLDMPYAEVLYWLELLKRENLEMQRRMNQNYAGR